MCRKYERKLERKDGDGKEQDRTQKWKRKEKYKTEDRYEEKKLGSKQSTMTQNIKMDTKINGLSTIKSKIFSLVCGNFPNFRGLPNSRRKSFQTVAYNVPTY